MSNLEKFLIELDRTPAVYAPGEHVIGRMFVRSEQTTKVKTIAIKLKGEALVSW